ncbi:MAG: DUF3775 domain-containing protein [Thiohalocapsa sp.]
MLATPLEQLAFIIAKAREFDAETTPVDPDDGSNPTDDRDVAILEDTPDNPTGEELADAIDQLNDDQKAELLALMWVGRGDFDVAEWPSAIAQAQETRDDHITDYLLGTPLLGDYLEEALAARGYSIEEFEKNRL